MVHVVITVVLLLAVSISLIAVAAPYIAQPNLHETSCKIQSLDIFELSENAYWGDMILLNTGDDTITSYQVNTYPGDITIERSQPNQIIPANTASIEFRIIGVADPFIEVVIFSDQNSNRCYNKLQS